MLLYRRWTSIYVNVTFPSPESIHYYARSITLAAHSPLASQSQQQSLQSTDLSRWESRINGPVSRNGAPREAKQSKAVSQAEGKAPATRSSFVLSRLYEARCRKCPLRDLLGVGSGTA